MVEFPSSPIEPAEFFESFVPARFAKLALPDPLARVTLQLGVHLHGDGGGEWLYHLQGGDLDVIAGGCDEASFTLIQSVEDWRGTLWEGRGGVVAERGLRLLRSGRLATLTGGGTPAVGSASSLDSAASDLIERLVDLDGVLRAVITDAPASDWAIALQFGPGEVPAEPTTTVSIANDDIHALANGDLDPMQAFMAGRVTIAGDMLLAMQLQSLFSELLDGRQGP
jgi:hypothetical protein